VVAGVIGSVLRKQPPKPPQHAIKRPEEAAEPAVEPRHVRRARHRRRARIALGIAIALVAVAGTSAVAWRRSDSTVPVAATASTTTTSSTTTTTTTAVPPPPEDVTYVATARFQGIAVFDSPEAQNVVALLPNPWFINDDPSTAVPLVFHVESFRSDGWAEVLLPLRPNGSTGWIRMTEATFSPIHYRVTVELGAHRLRVFQDNNVVLEDTVAVGAPATPTPLGRFYVRALLRAPNPNTVYGPYAFGLSGHSNVLEEFNGGDAEVGIHGNNDASVLGKDVSHGCVRMSNDMITTLTTFLPLGTPVEIFP
jgi:lipoprotein-anchoring transpeptidase ErfK/SrfK